MELNPVDWKRLFGSDTPSDSTVAEMNALMAKYGLNLTFGFDYCVCPVQWGGQCVNCNTSARRDVVTDRIKREEVAMELRERILDDLCVCTERIRTKGKSRHGYKE